MSCAPGAAGFRSSAIGFRPAAAWTPATGQASRWPSFSATATASTSGNSWGKWPPPSAATAKRNTPASAPTPSARPPTQPYFDAANKRYVIDEQIYYAFPLLVGITPEAERQAVLENLTRCIVEKNKGHLDTGMLGTMLLMEYLQEIGRDDLILGIYQKKDYPGWGYMVEQGATTLWEQWNGHWSQIHSCFTSADNWLYHGLAGIRPDPEQPGFKNVIIQPAIVGDITWAKARHDGPYGPITSHWQRDGDQAHSRNHHPAEQHRHGAPARPGAKTGRFRQPSFPANHPLISVRIARCLYGRKPGPGWSNSMGM